jgi:micrococcal nuclease
MAYRLILAAVLSAIAFVIWAVMTADFDSAKRVAPRTAESTFETYTVTRVLDGDTVVVIGGRKVRYIGIDAPETYGGGEENEECFAAEARKRNEELVLGKKVNLVKDVSEEDKYGRLLRYVYVEDLTTPMSEQTTVNEMLVREGFAHSVSYYPDTAKQDVLIAAENTAKGNGSGLWAEGTCR